MQDLVSELTQPVVLSDRALRHLARIREARAAHLQAHRREPRPCELVEATGLSRASLDALVAVERRPRGLDETVAAGDPASCTLGERVVDERAEDAYEDAARRLAGDELEGCWPQLGSASARSSVRGSASTRPSRRFGRWARGSA